MKIWIHFSIFYERGRTDLQKNKTPLEFPDLQRFIALMTGTHFIFNFARFVMVSAKTRGNGFYKWQKKSAGAKQPFYFYLKEKEVFGFAGLWETWLDKHLGESLETCTIITTGCRSSYKRGITTSGLMQMKPALINCKGFSSRIRRQKWVRTRQPRGEQPNRWRARINL